MSQLKQNGQLRWKPSYLRRQGQITPAQKRAIREGWDHFGLTFRYGERIKLPDATLPWYLEIGFGNGEHLLHLAQTQPESRFLGIEVHKPGIGAALQTAIHKNLENLRFMRGDSRLILADHLPDHFQFAGIYVLFPDPWPKDPKRRIIQTEFLQLLETCVSPQGFIHFATDVDAYSSHIHEVMAQCPNWSRTDAPRDFVTRYEARGLELGHTIQDFRFLRVSGSHL